jgi:hypothetical protein
MMVAPAPIHTSSSRTTDPQTRAPRPDGDELADLDVVAQARPDVEVAVPP